jgi:hypothetical protein
MIFSNYCEIVTPVEAEQYWQIFPPAPAENVVPMAQVVKNAQISLRLFTAAQACELTSCALGIGVVTNYPLFWPPPSACVRDATKSFGGLHLMSTEGLELRRSRPGLGGGTDLKKGPSQSSQPLK